MILVLIGKSGCGKTTVAKLLVEKYGYKMVRTSTTRPRREGEQEDAYYFMSKEEFQQRLRNDEFVEMDRYGDNLYGTLKTSLEESDKMIAILTPEGAEEIKKAFPDAFIVHLVTDTKTAVLRAVSREKELDPAKIDRISKRAMTDYHLYGDITDHGIIGDITCRGLVPAEQLVSNKEGQSLSDLADYIAGLHEKYVVKNMLKSTTSTLKECISDLEACDKKKTEGESNV